MCCVSAFAAHSDDRDRATRSARSGKSTRWIKLRSRSRSRGKRMCRQEEIKWDQRVVISPSDCFVLTLGVTFPDWGSSNFRLSKRLRCCALFQGVSNPFIHPRVCVPSSRISSSQRRTTTSLLIASFLSQNKAVGSLCGWLSGFTTKLFFYFPHLMHNYSCARVVPTFTFLHSLKSTGPTNAGASSLQSCGNFQWWGDYFAHYKQLQGKKNKKKRKEKWKWKSLCD